MKRWLRWTIPCGLGVLLLGPAVGMPGAEKPPAMSQPGADSLQAAIEDLMASFPGRYPQGPVFLGRLQHLKSQLAQTGPAGSRELREQLKALQREALLANPQLRGQPLLYVVRRQYRPDHHNTETMFQNGEINTDSFTGGGSLKTLDLATGEVKTLLHLPEGVIRDPDVSFDGKKVLFSARRNKADDYHLFEMNRDGSDLKQLTVGQELSDIDPIYLPDGRILFTSTREPKYCMCNRHIMGNLFTMNADGSNLQQIGHSTLHEGHAALLPDGRVIYDRWEYVDRNFGDAQGVWVTNPDGTNHTIFWKNHTSSPGAVLDSRPIPGTPLFIATFSSCHDRPWGALAIIDRRRGLDGKDPVLRTWPAEAIELVGQGGYDTFTRINPKYEDPYPLSDKVFLCSRMTGKGEEMGIYLLDVFGNEVLVHREEPGCFDPMPLGPRPRPPVLPTSVDLRKGEGTFYVQNVYQGTGMERIPPGTVKYLRVVESPEKRYWTGPAWDGGTGQQAPGMAWDDFNNKRVLGTAPVEPDGSAYFKVPADTFVYFQLLDEEQRMVQSMRSGTIVRPGETAGCVGCHENRRSAGLTVQSGEAWRKGPNGLKPWYGPARLFSYVAEVQPVFDKHCVSCHDAGKDAGKKLNLSGDRHLVFNTSYVELRGKGYVKVVGAGPFPVQLPRSWGSYPSRLGKVVLEGHGQPEIDRQVKLDLESRDRILTWIDINAPYYPTYASAFPDHPYGRSPLSGAELKQLSDWTGVPLLDRRHLAAVNFARPELSPCLERLSGPNDSRRQQALALIRQGHERLAQVPRDDLPDFQPISQSDHAREVRYQERLKQETLMRAAAARGEKRYPPGNGLGQPKSN